jgi:hypothetical protein
MCQYHLIIFYIITGKFAQNSKKPQTTIVNSPSELYKMLADPAIAITSIDEASDDMFYVNWEYVEELIETNPNTSVIIAAFTTASARIRLYRILQKLGDKALYFDTDSVIILHYPGEYLPKTGEFLGDLKDEILEYGTGSKIIEFVCTGPKSYSLRIAIGGDMNSIITITKVKGFRLNHSTESNINFDTLKMQVDGTLHESVVVNPKKIKRLADHTVVSVTEVKRQRLVYTKRWLTEEYCTLPYGYKL